MKPEECVRFESCCAPLCPIDEGGLVSSKWYPDENYCQVRAFCKLDWIRNQRKITKKTRDLDSYYTYRMLKHNLIIGKGITGIDSDTEFDNVESLVDRWLSEHPEKRIISDSERENLRNRMAKIRNGINPAIKDANRIENLNFK